MTREEASFYLSNMDRKYMEKGMSEALDMAIFALEQEPCTDAVSRVNAVRCVLSSLFLVEASEKIEKLPSVTPKSGHWIDYKKGRWIYAQCSECGEVHDSPSDYCPSCGCRMVEPQERSDGE